MSHSDTSPDAEAIQHAVYRRMSGAERLAAAFDMSLLAREFAFAGIRRDHPTWPELEIRKEFLRRQFPEDQIPEPLR